MNKAIHVLLGASILLALLLLYFLLAPDGQPALTPFQWLPLVGLALILGLTSWLAVKMRGQRRSLPQGSLSSSDFLFVLAIAAVLCPLAFFAVWFFGPLGTAVIMLAPIACIIRSPRHSPNSHK